MIVFFLVMGSTAGQSGFQLSQRLENSFEKKGDCPARMPGYVKNASAIIPYTQKIMKNIQIMHVVNGKKISKNSPRAPDTSFSFLFFLHSTHQ